MREIKRSESSPGERLREWRESHEVTQAELAARLEVSDKHISGLEAGNRTVSLQLAIRIQRELGIPVEAWEAA
jgi:transcriptional regulator with XRE-family HTH domain